MTRTNLGPLWRDLWSCKDIPLIVACLLEVFITREACLSSGRTNVKVALCTSWNSLPCSWHFTCHKRRAWPVAAWTMGHGNYSEFMVWTVIIFYFLQITWLMSCSEFSWFYLIKPFLQTLCCPSAGVIHELMFSVSIQSGRVFRDWSYAVWPHLTKMTNRKTCNFRI